MKLLHVTEEALAELCRKWVAQGLIATVQNETNVALETVTADASGPIVLRCARAYTPVKSLLFPARERVAVYSTSGGSVEGASPFEPEKRIVLGVRNCDLRAIALIDRIFLEGDYKDPLYEARRRSLVLVSVDCVTDAESCFCDLVGLEPFPTEGFDLNLSPVEGGYVVEVGGEAGSALIDSESGSFTEASTAQLAERESNRKAIKAKLVAKNAEYKTARAINEVIGDVVDSERWQEEAKPCVECGACTNICPTCHCFYLFDRLRSEPGSKAGQYDRVRTWDSCIFADYARMAGGEAGKPNPRPQLRSRLENRFTHKYLYIPQTYGVFGCTGCGRCSDACLGGIDPRKVIKNLEK